MRQSYPASKVWDANRSEAINSEEIRHVILISTMLIHVSQSVTGLFVLGTARGSLQNALLVPC